MIDHSRRQNFPRGLSAPRHPIRGETFEEYCRRFGIGEGEIGRLLEGLNEQTAVLANVRLASYLIRHLPEQWQEAMRRNELKRIKRTKGGTR